MGARFLSESRATMIHPTLNCRPPWGSQTCDTVVDFSIFESLLSRLGGTMFVRKLRTGARFWRELLLPRSELQTPMGEPEV